MNFNADFARPPVQPSPPSASDPFAMRKLQLLPAPPSPSTDEYRGPALSMRGALRTEADSVSQPMQAYADYRSAARLVQVLVFRYHGLGLGVFSDWALRLRS